VYFFAQADLGMFGMSVGHVVCQVTLCDSIWLVTLRSSEIGDDESYGQSLTF